MHDFALTIVYGNGIIVGSLLQYLVGTSSSNSKRNAGFELVWAFLFGVGLLSASKLSLQAFNKGNNSYFAMLLQTVLAVTLTWVMGQRYHETGGEFMPAGFATLISGLMIVFYIYKIATGGNHLSKKEK